MSETAIELTRVTSRATKVTEPEAAYLASDSHTADENGLVRAPSSTTTRKVTSKAKRAVIIASITLVTGVASMLNGLVTVILPTLQQDLHLSDSILLW